AGDSRPAIKDIANWFSDRYGEEYERKVTAKWIGGIIRKKLRLKTQKSHGVFVIPLTEKVKLEHLWGKYGVESSQKETAEEFDRKNEPC
ncbi:MAG TPA: hypothetical protein PLA90_19210, partial [Candidatus Sumerlaeota bacterium]|nr:hypothetical protein [Candidatus Sumerlaeota bacterium]